MHDFGRDIGTLVVSLRNQPELASRIMSAPHVDIWDAPKKFHLRVNSIPNDYLHGFKQFVLASYLLSQHTTPQIVAEWLKSNCDLQQLGLPFNWQNLTDCRWGRVAYALVSADKSNMEIKYALVGYGRNSIARTLPEWCDICFDSKAHGAILIALERISTKVNIPEENFFLWPILPTIPKKAVFHGPSIALPTYLGWLSLAKQQKISSSILCTGALSSHGELQEVNDLPEKFALACEKEFGAFIYPYKRNGEKTDPLSSTSVSLTEKLDADSLAEAERYWQKYTPGKGNPIRQFNQWLEDPRLMAENITDSTDSLFPLRKEDYNEIKEKLGLLIMGSPSIASSSCKVLIDKLEAYVKNPNWNPIKLFDILNVMDELLISKISELGGDSPKLAFRLALIQMRKANHTGKVSESEKWAEACRKYFESMDKNSLIEDDRQKFLAMFIGIIGTRHNAFHFSPELPNEIVNDLNKSRKNLQSKMRLKRKSNPRWNGSAANILGQYYGTMMQHNAFCGPKRLKSALDYSEKALDAFGYSSTEKMDSDCGQQFSYRVFAFLDDGRFQEAEEALLIYLQAIKFEEISIDTLDSPYKHACLARYIADAGIILPNYVDWARKNFLSAARHPWQLWLYNMGRVEQDTEWKKKFWFKSLEYCQAGGITIQVMALLSLSALSRLTLTGEECERVHRVTEEVLNVIKGSDELYQCHFMPIIKGDDWEVLLRKVSENVQRYFPFSYR